MDGEGLAVARTQWYRIIHPRKPSGDRRLSIERGVWPPVGVGAYSFEEALGVLLVLNARWLETGRWPPEAYEPWAEPVRNVRTGDRDLPVGDPPEGSWTLRDYAVARLDNLAACRGLSLDRYLAHELPPGELGEDEQRFLRALRFEFKIRVTADGNPWGPSGD